MPVSLQQILLSILGLIILISQISVYFDRKLLINLNVNLASFNQQKTEPNNAATTPVLSKPYTKNTKPLILFYEIEYLGDTRPGGTGKLDQFCKNECDYQHVAKPSDQEIENMNGQISVLDPTKYWNFKKANLIVFSAEAPRRSPPFVFFRDQLDAQAKLFPGKNAGEKFANYRDLENVPWVLWESRTPNEEYIYDYNRKNNIYNYTFGYSKTFDIRNLAGSPFERAGTIYGSYAATRLEKWKKPAVKIQFFYKNLRTEKNPKGGPFDFEIKFQKACGASGASGASGYL